MMNVINYIKKNILLISTFSIVIILLLSYLIMTNYGNKVSQKYATKYKYFTITDTIINNTKTVYIYDNIDQLGIVVNPIKYNDIYTFNRIISQLNSVKYRLVSHNTAIDYFIIQLYYFITFQIIFMIIVLILGLIISKKGWGDSSERLLISFVIACGFLLFFQIFPKGLKMEYNLNQNKHNFQLYTSINNEIFTYLSSDIVNKNFTINLDLLLKNYHSISFDLEEIPFSTIKNQFDEIRSVSD